MFIKKCTIHLDAVYTSAYVLTSMVYIVFQTYVIRGQRCHVIFLKHPFQARPLEGTYIVTPHVLEYLHTNGSTWMQKYYTGVIILPAQTRHVFKGKSLKTTVHLLLVWLPQNGSHLMIPASPSLVRRYQPSRPSERSGWEERPGYTQLFSSKQADSFCKQFKAAIFH